MTNAVAESWTEYFVIGPVETQRYRTNNDASVCQFWSEQAVPGLARRGWNTTRSQNVALTARRVLRDGVTTIDRR